MLHVPAPGGGHHPKGDTPAAQGVQGLLQAGHRPHPVLLQQLADQPEVPLGQLLRRGRPAEAGHQSLIELKVGLTRDLSGVRGRAPGQAAGQLCIGHAVVWLGVAQDAVQIKHDGRKGRGYTFHLGLSMTAGLPSRSTTSFR